MSKFYYVYSTSSASTWYVVNEKSEGGLPPKEKGRVFIEGGANIATKKLITPKGVVTKVTEAQRELLQESESFLKHKAAGFIFVSDKPYDPDKVAKDMKPKDKSAPITKGGETGKVDKDKDKKK